MLFAPLSCLCDCKAGGGAMARHTERLLYEERKAQILAALEANGPMFNPELATYLGWSYHVVLRVTRRMENEGILAYGTRGSVAGWVIADPVPVVEPVQRPPAQVPLLPWSSATLEITPLPLFQEAEKYLSDRVVLPDSRFLLPLVLWATHTYVWEASQFELPYVFFTGVSGSGKNRAMGLVGALSHNYRMVSKATEASMRDMVAEERPTLGVEECEKELRNHNSYVHTLFNSGSVPTGNFYKIVSGVRTAFSVYCPKMATSISDPEDSLRTRCIIVPMITGTPAVDDRIAQANKVGRSIGARLESLVVNHEKEINHIYNHTGYFKPNELLAGRDWQIWQPLYALCRILIPEQMGELEHCSTYCASLKTRPLRTVKDMHELKADNELVWNCKRLVADAAVVAAKVNGKNIASTDLIAGLLALPHGWWEGYQSTDSKGHGVGIGDGESGLMTMAKMFKLAAGDTITPPIPRYIAPGKSARGYVVAELQAAAKALQGK